MGSEASSRSRGADYLEHYGVKGMQWGVRRTKAQLARAGAAAKAKSKERKESADAKIKAERKALASKRRTLSEGDLDALTSRIQKEQKLKELVAKDVNPGKKEVGDILKQVGSKSAKAVGTASAIAVGAHFARKGLAKKGIEKDFKLPKK